VGLDEFAEPRLQFEIGQAEEAQRGAAAARPVLGFSLTTGRLA
jgi:hypothetical protein